MIEDEIIREAIKYNNNGENNKAIQILKDGLQVYSQNKNLNGLLGITLSHQNNYIEAKKYLEKAIELGSEYELVYLSLYITYANLDFDEKAVKTVFKYLEDHKAYMFKDTLEELLEGLEKGYMSTYRDEIIYYAKENNVPIPITLKIR